MSKHASRIDPDAPVARRAARASTDPPSTRSDDLKRSEHIAKHGPERGKEDATVRPRRSRRRVPLVVAGVLLVLLAGVYLVGYLAAGDKLPKDAEVSGVDVGGLPRAQAIARLSAALGPQADQPQLVTIDGTPASVTPADAGLRVDYAASVAAAGGGKSFDPRKIFQVLTGGSSTEAVVSVDETRLASAVRRLAATFDRRPTSAALAYAGVEVRQTPAQPGVTVKQDAAAAALRDGFLRPDAPIALPVATIEPEITNAEVDQVVTTFAKPAVSAPVTVKTTGSRSFQVPPAAIARAVTFATQGGTLAPRLDAKVLRTSVDAVVAKALTRPKNATVRLAGGAPKVVPPVSGTAVSAENLVKAVQPVLPVSGAARVATVQVTSVLPAFGADQAAKLGIKRVTGKFTTYFSDQESRNVNITRAAAKINNTVLKPGASFSLNKVVGRRTRANGFTESTGKGAKDLGDGVSQAATTTFNAMFLAGLKDVYHRPHSTYFNRYPAGREAAVAWPKPDLKVKNDTKYGVLIQAYVVKATSIRRGSVTVRIWSTPTYDEVRASLTVRSNVTSARSVTNSSASCRTTSGSPGFDATYQRLFYRGGAIVRTQKFNWHYVAANKVTCR